MWPFYFFANADTLSHLNITTTLCEIAQGIWIPKLLSGSPKDTGLATGKPK